MKIIWIPSHCKIYGNEQADLLAKFGVARGLIYNRDISSSEYYPKLKEYSISKWQICWNSSDKGRWCYSICPKVSHFPWFKNIPVGEFRRVFSSKKRQFSCW